ncbi:YlbF family regulator [Paenibacillus sp. TRM 82003]|nr:YlbF family regulator [Paenibacillus sp. TRM 82003]
MSLLERQALDFSLLMTKTSELNDALMQSVEVADYVYWKERMENDPETSKMLMKMNRVKQLFEECERFGHYHPNYHEALEKVRAVEEEMETIESVREFKRAEKALDELLYDVSVVIAHAVSDSIKVPSNDPLPKSGGGCGTGGSCGCS